MHKLVVWIFTSLINLERFLRIVCVFFIMMMSLYWIQNLIGASWWWMGFIAPVLEYILDVVNNIYSFSFDFWGKTIEVKYFNALILLLIMIFGLKLINIGLEKLFDLYDDAHRLYKKTTEKIFNTNLENKIKFEEKMLNNYYLYVQTRITKRYLNKPGVIDLKIENEKINKFLCERTKATSTKLRDGYLYLFKDFENIDNLLELLFGIKESPVPIDYIMCIQVGNDTEQLDKLIDLQEWGKIIMSADTLCRYEYNSYKKYKTTSVGIFQRDESTLEVHEFVEEL